MSLHGLLSVTIGVPNVEETAAYYADFGLEPLDGGGIVGWDVVLENFRAAGGAHAARADDIFYGDGHAGKRRQRAAGGDKGVHAVGLRVGAIF